jgi:hypothetical protein
MPHLIGIIEIEDSASWEAGFRTHSDLFRSQGIMGTYRYAIDEDDRKVVLYAEVEDLDRYLEVLQSPATAEAMANDGVNRETVKIVVLDKELQL